MIYYVLVVFPKKERKWTERPLIRFPENMAGIGTSMDLNHIPRSAPRNMLPGLKLRDLVQLRNNDYSQDKRAVIKTLKRGTVGRVTHIYDMGRLRQHLKYHRFLIYVRIPGHPETNFWSEELTKVAVR